MELTFSETGQQDIVLTNADICSEEMSLEESICSDEDLRFGACEASCFKVRVVNSGSFKGKDLVVRQKIRVDDERYLIDADGNRIITDDGKYLVAAVGKQDLTIVLGRYKVYSDEPSNDRMWRDLTCYDQMYEILNADVSSWYSALTFPMTIKNLRDSFFTYLGITQETVTLINDVFETQGGFITEGTLSGKTVIEAICELNGCFGHINRSGNFEYIYLPTTDSITYRWYADGTGKYEDYETEAITGITARAEATDVGASVGTTDNVLIIENNPLIFGAEGTLGLYIILANLLGVVSQITYRPFNVDTYGNPMLPIGTGVTVNTKKYDPENGYTPFAVESFVKSRTLKGIQGLVDSISATGKPQRDAQVNNIQSQILRTKGKVHLLRNTVDELYSEIYDADTGIKNTIQQLSNETVLKINGAGRLVEVDLSIDPSTATSYASILADDISFIANGKIELTSNSLEINSTNFKVDSTGKITCTSGNIGGWDFDNTRLYKQTGTISPSQIYSVAELTSSGLKWEYNVQNHGGHKFQILPEGIYHYKYNSSSSTWIKDIELNTYDIGLGINDIYRLNPSTGYYNINWGDTGKSSLNSAIGSLVKSGSVVKTLSTSTTDYFLFSNSDLNTILGVSDSSNQNTTLYVANGDSNAHTQHVIATYYSPSTTNPGWYVKLSAAATGNYRFNYIIAYNKT